MKISEVQEIFTNNGINAKVMPGMLADILVIFVKQDKTKINEAIATLKENNAKVFKFINVVDKDHVTGKIKVK